MPYAIRNEAGEICGLFEQMQEGTAEEFLSPDDPAVVAFIASAKPTYYQISKMTPWLRMSPAEAELVYGAMAAADTRLRAIYDAAPYLRSDDPLWPTMHDILANTLSPTRADELLSPEAQS